MENQYLYHYTNIETLSYILKYKTIRFTPLNTVDDLIEGHTNDYGSIGQWILVSCWTDMEEENISLWNLYSKNMTGIRIRLRKNPFKNFSNFNSKFDFITDIVIKDTDEKLNFILVYPREPLIKIDYVPNYENSLPCLLSKRSDNDYSFDLHMHTIGNTKDSIWSFQREWRYKIFLLPKDLSEINRLNFHSVEEAENKFKELFSQKKGLLRYHDLELTDDSFENFEILLGPKCSESDEIIVNSLVETFNKNAIIRKSKLKIRNRNL